MSMRIDRSNIRHISAKMASNRPNADEEKKRKENWTYAETIALLEAILENRAIVVSSLTPEITAKKKNKAWKEISQKVTEASVSLYGRTVKEVKEKFNGLKKRYRGKKTQRNQTGAGAVPADPFDHLLEMIIGKDSHLIDGVKESK